jgi:hypothetical protein
MGIESDRVVCMGEEKRNCKEIALGVEQEKVEGKTFSGPWFPLACLYLFPWPSLPCIK